VELSSPKPMKPQAGINFNLVLWCPPSLSKCITENFHTEGIDSFVESIPRQNKSMADYFHGGINSMAESPPPEELIPRYRLPEAINCKKVPKCVPPVTISTQYAVCSVFYCVLVWRGRRWECWAVLDTIYCTSGRIQRKTWSKGVYAGVDCNLTLCRLRHISLCQSRP
jgi:hypothetical protein